MSLEGKQIGRYRILQLLGSGGMGDVYLAEDARIEQQVAIKVIRSETNFAAANEAEKEMARLFHREAKAIVKLDHPNILPLYDYGEEQINTQSLIYLVMPYRPEGSLAERLRKRTDRAPLSTDEVEHILSQASGALQHAHDRQIVHQDVKPSNFLIRDRKETPNRPDLLLADFGIARLITATASVSQSIRGTPTYMAPEQWQGSPQPATDQYALAIMAYELLTGQPPFRGGPGHLMYQHLSSPPALPSTLNPLLSTDVDTVLMHALAKEPQSRFASITAFANAFRQSIRDAPVVASSQLILETDTTISNTTLQAVMTRNESDPLLSASPLAPADQARNSDAQVVVLAASSDNATPQNLAAEESAAMNAPTQIKVPLPVSESSNIAPASGKRRTKHRTLAFALTSTLLIVFLAGGAAAAMSGVFFSKNNKGTGGTSSPGTPIMASSAIMTITPSSTNLNQTFTIFAVTGTPDAAKNQVHGARILSTTTGTYTETANATGQGTIPGTHASGTVLVDNWDPSASLTLDAGSVYSNTYSSINIHMVLDATVTVPPAPYSGGVSQRPTQGHILEVGTIGNNEFNNNFHHTLNYDVFNNPPFSNGRDPQTYTAVQQSDIDGAASALESANAPNAKHLLQSQMRAGEQFIGSPSCSPNVTANHAAGDNATTVTVTVSFTCIGEVYDVSKAVAMAEKLLTSQAANSPGSGYMLVGSITTSVGNVMLADAKSGTISIAVNARGTWMFQFSNAREVALKQLVAGKSKSAATTLLTTQPGIARVVIQLSGRNASILPADASQIKIVVETTE
jgi:VCBS repeat-containing protein